MLLQRAYAPGGRGRPVVRAVYRVRPFPLSTRNPEKIRSKSDFLQCGRRPLAAGPPGVYLSIQSRRRMAGFCAALKPHSCYVLSNRDQAFSGVGGQRFQYRGRNGVRPPSQAGLRPALHRIVKPLSHSPPSMPGIEFEVTRASARGQAQRRDGWFWTADADHTGSGANLILSTSATSRRCPSTARRTASSTVAAFPHNGFPARF
jgi:hypothetical protein